MKLQVIVGATREGRVSDKAAKWVAKEAREILTGYDVEILDLRDYEMPFFNESISPQYNPDRKPEPAVKKWLDKISEADAYVFVTPEYNRAPSAVLKNAIDYVAYELEKKPIALVAHGSTGGAQAVSHLRGILAGALSFSVPRATYFSDGVASHIDEEGNLSDKAKANPYGPESALKTTLTDLKWYSDALAGARAK
jgi:NAD(P)H-dependent FMN reductase